MFKLIIILVVVINLRKIEGACKTCNGHGVACMNDKSFHPCIDGKIDETMILHCNSDEICTDLAMVCVPIGTPTVLPACSSLCDVCEPKKTFGCTSVRTFALCGENGITNVTGTCPSPKVCDTAGPSVCVQPCDVNTLTCDKDVPGGTTTTTTTTTTTIATPTPSLAPSPLPSSPSPSSSSSSSSSSTTIHTPTPPVTPTPTPSLTPTPTQEPTKTPEAVCNEKKIPGRFPLSDNNNECSNNYVYCRMQGSNLIAVPSKCPTGRSFNKTTQSCEVTPAGCVA